MNEWGESAIRHALGSVIGWTAVVLGSTIGGICIGYWIGHQQVTSFDQTLSALSIVPLLWLFFPPMFIAYVAMGLGWYLPLKYESLRLRLLVVVFNSIVWLFVIRLAVVESANGKFFRY